MSWCVIRIYQIPKCQVKALYDALIYNMFCKQNPTSATLFSLLPIAWAYLPCKDIDYFWIEQVILKVFVCFLCLFDFYLYLCS